MRELLFIRHGATAGNLERRYIGRTDEPLCPLGEAQARALAEQGLSAEHLFVSPALRTVQTARLVFPELPFEAIEDFWETDFGIFEGKTAAELWEDARYRAWVDGGCRGPVPEGETVDGFKARCCRAFLEVLRRLPDGCRAAFVLHGGCIMAIMEAFARPKRDFYAYHIPNGGVIRCVCRDGALLMGDSA